jgi:putative nucleotidyltransferase with HDIG domain
MTASTREYAHPVRLYALIGLTTIAAATVFLVAPWSLPDPPSTKFWNGVIAFALLSIACDTSFLRMSFANVNSSVAFVPFLASVMLFAHPWPMLISGATAAIVDSLVRRKPAIRVLFNTAQYMLAVGVGQLLYTVVGGRVGTHDFHLQLLPFMLLVATYFVINSGSVTLAISYSSGVSIRESWSRLIGGAVVYDVFSSGLGLLLAFLYVRLDFAGLAVLLLPLFFVRHIYQMNQQLELKNREQLNLMVRAMEARDPYTSGHSVRVSEYARAMARELGLSARQVDSIETAALLHDVGKMYEEFVPLLRKDGKLTVDERRVMQSHPVRSAELVSTSAGLRGEVESAIRHHHENYDGTGYPDGLSGDEIPMGARVIMIADTLDAMTTDRPYRRALSFDRAVQELVKHSGTQFDPALVQIVMRSAGIRRIVEGPSSARPLGLAASEKRTQQAAERVAVG